MRKKKHQFHCVKCGSEAYIYKKGRSHRLMVCPKCGIIASNPLPLLALAATAAPTIIDKVGGLFSKKKKKAGKEEENQAGSYPRKITTDSLDKPNKGERYVLEALKGG